MLSPAVISAFIFSSSSRRYIGSGNGNGVPAKERTICIKSSSSSSSEFGELAASKNLPQLNSTLIEAALERLPWEIEDDNDDGIDEDDSNNNDDNSYSSSTTAGTWENGQQWYETRQLLTNQWILPRDLTNGSWESYGIAANKGEEKMLNAVPQLLRLNIDYVGAAAKTLLSVLKLPPALVRREPILLTMKPDRLEGGFESLLLIEKKNRDDGSDNDSDDIKAVRESCRDTSGMLLEAATKWEQKKELIQ
ncbi:MAG: hypothetical protein ACI90V_008209 [Bacillariaceae sp.]|jgi:hypothetical protein